MTLAGVVIAGCTTDASSLTRSVLERGTYDNWVVEGHRVLPDSDLSISFREGHAYVKAGCNDMAAPYHLATDGPTTQLVIAPDDWAMTLIGCRPAERAIQDHWIRSFLSKRPRINVHRDQIRLTRDEVSFTASVA